MLPVRGLLLNSKMLIAFLCVELMAIIALDVYFYRNWTDVKFESIRKSLVSQVELLSQQALDLPNGTIKLKLSLPYVFQVVNEDKQVLWDSVDSTRITKKIETPHFLLSHALKNPIPKDLIEFDEYYGAFKRNSAQMIAIGAISKNSIAKDQTEFLEKLVLMSFLVLSLSSLFAILLFHIAGSPLRRITYASLPFLHKQLTEMPELKSGEPAILAQAFQTLSHQIMELMQEGIQKVRIEQEIEIAASMQKSLIPNEHIVTDRYELESFYASTEQTGGDYWGYFETKKYLVMYVADATGHGLSSSMVTSAARGCFAAIQQLLKEFPEFHAMPSLLLRFVNQAIMIATQDELNMTMFIATYSFDDHKLYYASAGHNPAWVVQDQNGESQIQSLHSKGARLGESADYESPLDQSITFGENDVLCLYTDGILDAMNEQGEALGRKNAKRNFLNVVKNSKNLQEVKKEYLASIAAHTKDHPLEDDLTFMLFKLKGGRR